MPDINFGATVGANNNSITLNTSTGTWSNPTFGSFQFVSRTPYGSLYTYASNASTIPIINSNPTIGNTSYFQLDSASYSTPAGIEKYGYAAVPTQYGLLNSNKTAERAGASLTNQAVRGALTIGGFPALTPFSGKLLEAAGNQLPTYATTGIGQLNSKYFGVPLPYLDFRARKTTSIGSVIRDIFSNSAAAQAGAFGPSGLTGGAIGQANEKQILTDENIISLIDRRYDGASAALRGSALAAAQSIASTTTGVYTIFNLDTVYGWGQQDDPYAIRNDYTLRSSIAKSIKNTTNVYRKVLAGLESALPFRGDRVNAIDFKKRTWQSIYQWAETDFGGGTKLDNLRKWAAKSAEVLGINPYGTTKDFIKFFITAPGLYQGAAKGSSDYALVFRALLSSFTDQFSPSWSPVNLVGRADPNYQYGGTTRDIDLGFTVYATDRDELRFLYRKLNYLASFTYPEYNRASLSTVAPWIRITVGDLLVSQAAVISSLSYTFVDADTTWEINFENDPEMMQVPHKIDVSLGLHLVGNQLPEKLGSMYSLSKEFNKNGVPISTDPGKGWLYDSKTVTRAAGTGEFLNSGSKPTQEYTN